MVRNASLHPPRVVHWVSATTRAVQSEAWAAPHRHCPGLKAEPGHCWPWHNEWCEPSQPVNWPPLLPLPLPVPGHQGWVGGSKEQQADGRPRGRGLENQTSTTIRLVRRARSFLQSGIDSGGGFCWKQVTAQSCDLVPVFIVFNKIKLSVELRAPDLEIWEELSTPCGFYALTHEYIFHPKNAAVLFAFH